MTQPIASGRGRFDPATFTVVEPRTFEDLKVGDIFRAPSRTLTDAHATAFQAVSADNHPIHYNVEYARSHGHTAPVVHGLQVLAFTAPGATLFPQYIGDVFIAFTSASCTFLAEVHAGDTLYPQLEITDLAPHGDAGQVTTRATIHNQHGQLVLDGEHTYLLKTAQQGASEATAEAVRAQRGLAQPFKHADALGAATARSEQIAAQMRERQQAAPDAAQDDTAELQRVTRTNFPARASAALRPIRPTTEAPARRSPTPAQRDPDVSR